MLGSRVGEPLNQRKIGSSSVLMPEWGFEGCIGVGWMRGEQSPHQRNRHLKRCGDKGAGHLGRNVIPNTQEKEHEETQASEALIGGSGTVQKSRVRVLSAQHWPCRWASAPIGPSVTGLSSLPAMVPCFGSFPKQHPRTHVGPPPPPTPAEVRSQGPCPTPGRACPPPQSFPSPPLQP